MSEMSEMSDTAATTTLTSRRSQVRLSAAVVGAALLLGACSRSDERQTRGAETPTTSAAPQTAPPTSTQVTSPQDTGPAAEGGQASSDASSTTGFSTEQCRLDPGCPSSEHRTSDPCGAELVADVEAYLAGRRDAEQGRPFEADDGRAGYAQGWCDGGGR
jgi:hypothetical protein